MTSLPCRMVRANPNDKQWKTMLEKLLADRFNSLTFHREKQVLSVYALTVGKDGPKNLTANPSGGPASCLVLRGNSRRDHVARKERDNN